MARHHLIEYVDHEFLTNRFHVTHYGGCAVLFNKNTFLPDIKVKSIYHDIRHIQPDKVVEGESGWVIPGVVSRAAFRRQPHGVPLFTVLSLHINNNYAKKRGIGKKLLLTIRAVMLDELVDLVAGISTGPLGDATPISTISVSSKKRLPTPTCRCLPAAHHCGVQGGAGYVGGRLWVSQAPKLQ